MASKRLTIDDRSRIASRAVVHAFDEREATLRRQATELAAKARDELLGDKAVQFAKCPREWFAQVQKVWIGEHGLSLSERISMTADLRYGNLDYSGRLLRQIAKCSEAQKELNELRRQKHREITAILGKFSTFAALEKGWPEIWPFARDMVPEPAPHLPPARLDALNAELGLPPESVAAA